MRFNWYACLFFAFSVIAVSGCKKDVEQHDRVSEDVESLINRAKQNLVYVDGGEFFLGDVGNDEGRPFNSLLGNNKPAIKVKLDSYSISRYETTWGDFMIYLTARGRANEYTAENGFSRAAILPITANDDLLSPNYHLKPARSPNFSEAEGYCNWLGEQTGLGFALPTEAQWEFAARSRGEVVGYATASGRLENDPYLRRPSQYVDPSTPVSGNALVYSSLELERRPVGSYPPNSIGLYDMTGNVPEWTRDWYYDDFYQFADRHNPHASERPANGGAEKTVRDWAGHGDTVGGQDTVFGRAGASIDSPRQGFRCVVNSQEPISE